jgi:hypothetical protein
LLLLFKTKKPLHQISYLLGFCSCLLLEKQCWTSLERSESSRIGMYVIFWRNCLLHFNIEKLTVTNFEIPLFWFNVIVIVCDSGGTGLVGITLARLGMLLFNSWIFWSAKQNLAQLHFSLLVLCVYMTFLIWNV